MDREGFRNRLKQYKKAREENPGLKYWEWKDRPAEKDIPKYDEGTSGITQPFVTDGNNWRKRPTQELLDAFYKGDIKRQIELAQKAGQLITYSNPTYILDEVVVTANRPKQNQYSELDFAKDVAGFVPILGDAVDIYDAGKALYNGNYSLAAFLGAGLLLPNWLEKSGKLIAKRIKNYLLDRRYLRAIKKGDLETALRLRDEHFLSAAKNTKVIDTDGKPKRLYHGTDADYNIYDPSFFGTATDDGYYGVGLYATEDFDTARSYGDIVKTLYANVESPYTAGVYDVTGRPYPIKVATERSGVVSLFNRDLSGTSVPQEFKYLLPELQKADGVFYSIPNMRFNEVVIPKSSQMKYADAVVYDDNGKIIKLSKRDDFDNPDMRYAEGGEVEPDPLEVLERSRPKVNGIPINDKPLSGTDPLGEAYLNLVSGNIIRKAIARGIKGMVRKSFYNNYKELLKAGFDKRRAYNYALPEMAVDILPGIAKGFDYTIKGANYIHAAENIIEQ